MDLAIGPYAGKETGETALLRKLMHCFGKGDIAVLDRYYCGFMMIAAMLSNGADVCCRKHHLRKSDFRRGKRLGKYDHLIVWTRPKRRPKWMDEQTYRNIRKTITLREVKLTISQPGFRTKSLIVITTLTDAQKFSTSDIADLYGFRWNVELDIRSIKSNLNLDHVRCKSPAMVRRELWTTLLAYNLIRSTSAAAAMLHQVQPRTISFTSCVQFVLQEWKTLSRMQLIPLSVDLNEFALRMLACIAKCQVANRPGRVEPRVLKKRLKPYKLMMQPRSVLKKRLIQQ
jgi:hypothetical protein